MATIRCVCPPGAEGETRHPDGDTVVLRERLDFRSAMSIRNTVALARDEADVTTGDILAILTESYLLHGIESWTLVDDRGKAVEPTKVAIRAFLEGYVEEAMAVADEADSLYMEKVMLPLILPGSTSSRPTPTDSSTSPTTGSAASPRKPSKRSSISTIQTAVTGTTSLSPDGDSSSSPRLKSAG